MSTQSKTQISQEQLRQRRRQKVLARMAQQSSEPNEEDDNNRTSQVSTASFTINNDQKDKQQGRISAFEMYDSSKRHQKLKSQLQIASIVLGVISAALDIFTQVGQLVFLFLFFTIVISSAYIQIKRSKKVNRFTNQNTIEDPLLSKVTNIKQLDIANKILNIQASISPITKLLASYFLSTILVGCFQPNSSSN